MLILQGITYAHPNGDLLFSELSLSLNKNEKIALIGNNGAGKSTLLKLMRGIVKPTDGVVRSESIPYYVPQVVGQFNHLTVSQALEIDEKRRALADILQGDVSDHNLAVLDNDWNLEERCAEAFSYWNLDVHPDELMLSLSGGQKTKVFLAGISIHQPRIVLMDEPSNHLDAGSRQILYNYMTSTSDTLVVVSHDRELLRLLDHTCELDERGITRYGGNVDFYSAQKESERAALAHEVRNKEKALRKAKEVERETMERQQKLDARGKRKQEKAGLPTIMMNTFRNNAEKSTARIKDVHAGKLTAISGDLSELRRQTPDPGKMKMDLVSSNLHRGKTLVKGEAVNFSFKDKTLWRHAIDFEIISGSRVAIKGANGSGKTTLIRLMLGTFQPTSGAISRAAMKSVYIDQDYSLIDNNLAVYEQAQRYNDCALEEHEVKIRLNWFLFGKDDWNKRCGVLSGGEKLRLMLCCLMVGTHTPDLIVLDEPTNNLDLQNIEILTSAINEYEGTVLVISHDEQFLREVGVDMVIEL